MEPANRLLDAAGEIQAFCEQNHWPFCFIGGIAVLHWGEARVTRDADLTVFTGVGDEVRQDLVELLDLKGDRESLSRLETILASAPPQ